MDSGKNNYIKSTELRKQHAEWRDINFINKVGFFPLFYGFKDHLKDLSGGAVSLFVYLGLNSNNQTGECYHSLEKIAGFFGKSTRTISQWIKELEQHKLIKRIQIEFNGVSHTFILPYGSTSNLVDIDFEDDDFF